MSHPTAAQPAARHPPKPADIVVAEAEAQWLFTEDELLQAPSILDGMTPETERETRFKGINFIMQVGMMLKLPQLTLSTASVFFNRFLMRYSLISKPDQPKVLHHYQIAATCLFLATKTEENIRRMKELIVACCRVAQKNHSLLVDEQSKDYWRWRDTILFNEDVLLETLCFDLTVESPHKILFGLLKTLGIEHNKKLRNAAWAFLNDSNLTTLCLLFSSRAIAAAAVYCAAKHCELDPQFPDTEDGSGHRWWEAQGVKWIDVKLGVNYMANLYENSTSKQPSGEQSIYVGLRTPITEEDEEEGHGFGRESTELRSDSLQAPASPGDWAGPVDVVSQAGSEKGTKRENGEMGDESERLQKKSKRQVNGLSSDHKVPNSTSHQKTDSPVPPVSGTTEDPDAGSEEGEVEE